MQIAERFKLTQAWWVSSELARRHSHFKIAETWPMDGFYHGLETFDPRSGSSVFMNFNGSIHLTRGDHRAVDGIGWQAIFEAEDPHEVVKLIETAVGWTKASADPTTPRSLTYRIIAAVLGRTINDRIRLTVGTHSYGASYFTPEAMPAWVSEFEGLESAVRACPDEAGLPLRHFWMIRRGDQPSAVLADNATLYAADDSPTSLMPLYRRARSLEDPVNIVLGVTAS